MLEVKSLELHVTQAMGKWAGQGFEQANEVEVGAVVGHWKAAEA